MHLDLLLGLASVRRLSFRPYTFQRCVEIHSITPPHVCLLTPWCLIRFPRKLSEVFSLYNMQLVNSWVLFSAFLLTTA